MSKTYRRGAARLAAAGVTAGLLAVGAFAGATTAGADSGTGSAGDTASSGGATGTLGDLVPGMYGGATVTSKDGKPAAEQAGLFKLSLSDGTTVYTYCIDLYNGADTSGKAAYHEVPGARRP